MINDSSIARLHTSRAAPSQSSTSGSALVAANNDDGDMFQTDATASCIAGKAPSSHSEVLSRPNATFAFDAQRQHNHRRKHQIQASVPVAEAVLTPQDEAREEEEEDRSDNMSHDERIDVPLNALNSSSSEEECNDRCPSGFMKLGTRAAMAAVLVLSIGIYQFTTLPISAHEDILHTLWMIPTLGLLLYMGLISGYVPSPLYNTGEVWPKQYAIFQLVFILLTALRLSGKHTCNSNDKDDDADDQEDYVYEKNFKELMQFTHWMGTNLHKLFFTEDGSENLVLSEDGFDCVIEAFLWFGASTMLSYLVNHSPFEIIRKADESNYLSNTFVFIRNLLLFSATNLFFIHENLSDEEESMNNYCRKEFGITPGLIAPDYPFSALASEFADAWKAFHPSHLTLVRLSHSILYPSVLLLLTQRRLTHFFIWLTFIEVDFFHLLADMFHYVSGPELAEERLEFQGQETDCYVNVQFWQNMLAYPLNFVYLTTSLGDTSTAYDEQPS